MSIRARQWPRAARGVAGLPGTAGYCRVAGCCRVVAGLGCRVAGARAQLKNAPIQNEAAAFQPWRLCPRVSVWPCRTLRMVALLNMLA
eukprot:scaffold2010_cov90-Phaeocystis_antarctica.AAC.1